MRKIILLFFTFYLLLFQGSHLYAQEENGYNARVKEKVSVFMSNGRYDLALYIIDDHLFFDTKDDEMILMAVKCNKMLNRPAALVDNYKMYIENGNQLDDDQLLEYANSLKKIKEDREAETIFELLEQRKNKRIQSIIPIENDMTRRIYQYDSIAYNIFEVHGPNSDGSDMSPVILGKDIVYITNKDNLNKEDPDLDIYVSRFISQGHYTAGRLLSKNLKTSYHDGPIAFYNDGKNAILTSNTKLSKKDKKGAERNIAHLQLFTSEFVNGDWTPIKPFDYQIPNFNIAHPAINEKGDVVIFTSDCIGGLGGSDLYIMRRVDQKWSEPVNLGPKVNTERSEVFPYIHNNTQLFFATDGRNGFGGIDIFKFDLSDPSAIPVNIGAPINTPGDDFSMTISKDGKTAMYTYYNADQISNEMIKAFTIDSTAFELIRAGVVDKRGNPVKNLNVSLENMDGEKINTKNKIYDGYFTMDVSTIDNGKYQLKINSESMATEGRIIQIDQKVKLKGALDFTMVKSITVHGTVRDLDTNELIPNINVVFIDPFTRIRLNTLTNLKGEFSIQTDPNKTYSVHYYANGYLNKNIILETTKKDASTALDIKLKKASLGETISLDPIYYKSNETSITGDDFDVLMGLMSLLRDNPELSLEIQSHTDSKGDDDLNMQLSQQRSDKLKEFLIEQGVDERRLVSKGFGETRLLNNCTNNVYCSESLHQKNRRTSFILTNVKF